MLNNINILGCGWLGLALGEYFIQKKMEVFGSTTSIEKIDKLAEIGIKPFLIDIRSSNLDLKNFLVSEVLIIAITSKNVQDLQSFIRNMENSKVKKVLFISSTSVYPNTNGITTENTQTLDSPLTQIESLFRENPLFETTILRFGGLFGYDRKPGNFVKPNRPIKNPEGYVNLIHRDDCIRIIDQIISKNIWNGTFNACANDHPKRRDFYLSQAAKVGNNDIVFDENSDLEYKIIDSSKLTTLLNYEFKYGNLMDI